MTFLALTPWLAWVVIGAALALTAAVFIIRPRRPSVVVPSLLVWRRVLAQTQTPSVWSRLRWLVSLLLSLAVAALIALALAGPVPRGAESTARRTLVVLDSSWSMGALTTTGETRWERARARARSIIASAAGEVALATTGGGVIAGPTADHVVLRSALDRATPSAGADRPWPNVVGADAVHFVSDGAVPHTPPVDAIVHSVFEAASNVAVTAFDVVMSPHSVDQAEVFFSVANYATHAQTVRLSVARGGTSIATRAMDLAAGGVHRETIVVPRIGDARFAVRVTADDNALAIDDDAAAWLATAEPLRVVVVGVESPLTRLLSADVSLQVATIDPAAYAQTTADVWVFDRWLPPQPPAGRAVLIVDPPASAWFGAPGVDGLEPGWPVAADEVLLAGVDSMFMHVEATRAVTRPALRPVVMSAANTPLVSIEKSAAGRFVVFGFSVGSADLASTPAVPVLVGNAIDWLGRPERNVKREPGAMVVPSSTTRVVASDGRSITLVARDGRVTARLDAPGLYLVESSGPRRVVRVSLDDARRSNLLSSAVSADVEAPAAPAGTSRPWTRMIALGALVLAAVEWVTWRRRITV